MMSKLLIASFVAVAHAANGMYVQCSNQIAKNSYCDCDADCGNTMCQCAAAQAKDCCDGRGQPWSKPVSKPPPREWTTVTTSQDTVSGDEWEWTTVEEPTPVPGSAASEPDASERAVDTAASEPAAAEPTPTPVTPEPTPTPVTPVTEDEDEEAVDEGMDNSEEELENCDDICATNTKDWDIKCTWQVACSGCSNCEQTVNCENWSELGVHASGR